MPDAASQRQPQKPAASAMRHKNPVALHPSMKRATLGHPWPA